MVGSDLAMSGGHNRTLATLVQGRWDLVPLIVGFVRATAKSRRAASGERGAQRLLRGLSYLP
jgi:hypothetical protein